MTIDNSLSLQNLQKTPPLTNTDNDQKLKEQTDKFEAFFLKKILDISMKHENSLFPADAGDKIYNSMYHDTLSQDMSGNFGFSELLFNYLKEQKT